jgi:hypothetical protein
MDDFNVIIFGNVNRAVLRGRVFFFFFFLVKDRPECKQKRFVLDEGSLVVGACPPAAYVTPYKSQRASPSPAGLLGTPQPHNPYPQQQSSLRWSLGIGLWMEK